MKLNSCQTKLALKQSKFSRFALTPNTWANLSSLTGSKWNMDRICDLKYHLKSYSRQNVVWFNVNKTLLLYHKIFWGNSSLSDSCTMSFLLLNLYFWSKLLFSIRQIHEIENGLHMEEFQKKNSRPLFTIIFRQVSPIFHFDRVSNGRFCVLREQFYWLFIAHGSNVRRAKVSYTLYAFRNIFLSFFESYRICWKVMKWILNSYC